MFVKVCTLHLCHLICGGVHFDLVCKVSAKGVFCLYAGNSLGFINVYIHLRKELDFRRRDR